MEDLGSTENQSVNESVTETNLTPTTTNESPSAETTPAAGSHQSGAQGSQPGEPGEAAVQAAIAAYNPNLKFKFLDVETNKQIEKDMEEWVKPFIKDADTETKMRQLFAKAYGMDHAKASREKFKTEVETLRSDKTSMDRSLSILSNYVQNDDLQSFFEALKIPEDKVLRYALNRVQYRDLPPEKRAEYDQSRSAVQKAAYLEQENQRLVQEYQSAQASARENELQSYLANPQVAGVAEQFDSRVGQGAFRNEVIKIGQYYAAIHQKEITVEQAVNEVLRLMGNSASPQSAPAGSVSNAAPSGVPGVSQTPDRKPVIPNIQGRGTSPAKKLPKSIEDLKKLRSAMEQAS